MLFHIHILKPLLFCLKCNKNLLFNMSKENRAFQIKEEKKTMKTTFQHSTETLVSCYVMTYYLS